jgi:hypothetical protein
MAVLQLRPGQTTNLGKVLQVAQRPAAPNRQRQHGAGPRTAALAHVAAGPRLGRARALQALGRDVLERPLALKRGRELPNLFVL